jgi:hypothetical protein
MARGGWGCRVHLVNFPALSWNRQKAFEDSLIFLKTNKVQFSQLNISETSFPCHDSGSLG